MGETRVKTVKKPWGRELWYAANRSYVGKILHIKRGGRLSLQYHRVKHETIYTLRGRLLLTLGRASRVVPQGRAVVIPPRSVHRFAAPYGPVTLLEASTPQLSDVVRLEDDYERVPQGRKRRSRRP